VEKNSNNADQAAVAPKVPPQSTPEDISETDPTPMHAQQIVVNTKTENLVKDKSNPITVSESVLEP